MNPKMTTADRLCTIVLIAVCAIGGCGRSHDNEVVLYSSVDDYVLDEVVAAFEGETGVRVVLLGDTEATKTTGLVERLLSERDRPRGDVWWSSEPFGTIRLGGYGVLEPATTVNESDFDEGWPASMRGDTWYGFALRSRVIAYATDRVEADEAPVSLDELTGERWSGRVGIARPQFGTTRGHMAALVDAWGAERFEDWLGGLEKNGLRVYDGNASVVRAIAHGEIDVGLTDTDDVYAAQRNKWDVAFVPLDIEHKGEGWAGVPFWIPNTAGLVAGGPNSEHAQQLLDFILSAEVEHMIARTDSRNTPIRPGDGHETVGSHGANYAEIAGRIPEAMAICERVLGP